jgi:nicotinamidase-related amidase
MAERPMASPANRPTAPKRDSERGGAALIVIDMINCFDFEGAEKLRPQARRLIAPLLKLRQQMDELGAPTIYVNDNFGEWHSEKSRLVQRALERAADIVGPLAPREEDYFIIKPQFSGFYATNLPLLLPKLGASRLVVTGIASDICVLFTAADAHMRDYALWVPKDAVAAELKKRTRGSLDIMEAHMGAEIAPTSKLKVSTWLKALDKQGVR